MKAMNRYDKRWKESRELLIEGNRFSMEMKRNRILSNHLSECEINEIPKGISINENEMEEVTSSCCRNKRLVLMKEFGDISCSK